MQVDGLDRKLLNLVQWEFPLTVEPYVELGRRLGVSQDDVIGRIEQLKAQGVIRLISPVLDSRRLGYQTVLVAMRVLGSQLDAAERLIGEHPGVSHGYEREHYFSLWFTLSTPPGVSMQTEIERLIAPLEVEGLLILPAVKIFKIGAYFNMDKDRRGRKGIPARPTTVLPRATELSMTDKLIINEIQQDLPLIPAPFSFMAARVNIELEDFLAHCLSLLQRGIMRRFGASINHRRAGFKANALTCWSVPEHLVDFAGQKLALLPQVSHCYERRASPPWQYNLFAMVHDHTREACQEIACNVSRQIGFMDCVLLFSTREFRKTRIKYLV